VELIQNQTTSKDGKQGLSRRMGHMKIKVTSKGETDSMQGQTSIVPHK